MKTQPVALGFIEGTTALEELRQRVAAGHHEYAIMLGGGGLLSYKTIRRRHRWHVTNDIDGSTQVMTDEELWTESHIGEALDKRALLDMSGDPILNVVGRGPVLASTIIEESRDAIAKAQEEARKDDGPLTFRLDAAPGAITINDAAGADEEWEPADPSLVLEPCDIGPHTVAQIDLAAIGMGFRDGTQRAAITSIELTIEDIDGLIEALRAIREDAIAHRGFALRSNGYWAKYEEGES